MSVGARTRRSQGQFLAPYHRDIVPWAAWKNYGTSLPTRAHNLSYLSLGLEYPTSGGSAGAGDWVEWDVFLASGTYTFTAIGITNTAYGIAAYSLDGASAFSSFDWYSGSAVLNVVKQATGVVVPTTGNHVLRATCTGKNASSSSWTILANWFTWTRTGA